MKPEDEDCSDWDPGDLLEDDDGLEAQEAADDERAVDEELVLGAFLSNEPRAVALDFGEPVPIIVDGGAP